MKKLSLIALVLGILLTAPLYAQEEKTLKRPENMGDSEFDDFKNTSFNVYEESGKLMKNLQHVDKEVKSYAGIMSTISTDQLKGHYKAITGISREVTSLNTNISELDEKGKDMVTNAANVTPKMKSVKATTNTKKSVEGLDVAKGNMKSIMAMLQEDTKLLTDELKSRGEPIE